jgi:hypothetical protein
MWSGWFDEVEFVIPFIELNSRSSSSALIDLPEIILS